MKPNCIPFSVSKKVLFNLTATVTSTIQIKYANVFAHAYNLILCFRQRVIKSSSRKKFEIILIFELNFTSLLVILQNYLFLHKMYFKTNKIFPLKIKNVYDRT